MQSIASELHVFLGSVARLPGKCIRDEGNISLGMCCLLDFPFLSLFALFMAEVFLGAICSLSDNVIVICS